MQIYANQFENQPMWKKNFVEKTAVYLATRFKMEPIDKINPIRSIKVK